MSLETSSMQRTGQGKPYPGDVARTGTLPRARRLSGKAAMPLSQAQLCFWFIYATMGETANVIDCLEIEGKLDISRLERAFQAMIKRHDVLRMRIGRGKPLQQAQDDAPFDLVIRDLVKLDPDEARSQQMELALEMQRVPFDLGAPPLLRAEVLKLAENRHRLLLCFPHIVADGGATGLFQRQLIETYQRIGAKAPPAGRHSVLQIGDHALSERAQLEDTKAAEDFWRARLVDHPHAIWPLRYLNLDQPVAHVAYLPLPKDVMQAWTQAMHRHRATLQMCFLSIVAMAVAEVTGQAKFALSSVLENRESPETETMMGPMLRVMPVPFTLGQQPGFADTLTATRAQVVAAYEHMNVPWSFPLGLLAKQRWDGNASRSLRWAIGWISTLYARIMRKARLHPQFLADYLYMEPRPPRSLLAAIAGTRHGGRAPLLSPAVNVNMLQAVFRPADAAHLDPTDDTKLTIRNIVLPERSEEAMTSAEPIGQWEYDTINCYVVDGGQGTPSLRIETSCLNAEGLAAFVAALRKAFDAGV